jgi:phosphatidylethanolamine/phosphatidyl-N-methylethanolamine N-methyltransferase
MISMKSYETAAYADFLLGAFRNPKGVSALTPSSPSLARAIAGEVDVSREGLVVELGPGTGAVTSALLARGIASERLLLVERESEFVLILRRLYPSLEVRCGDALQLEGHLKPSASVAAVVSGLPILHLAPEARRHLVSRSLACQGAGGLFIQLSYGWRPPVPPTSGISIAKRTVWSNFPPAHVWTYRSW